MAADTKLMAARPAERVPLRRRHWFIAVGVVPFVLPMWAGLMMLFGSAAHADVWVFGVVFFAPLAYPPAAILAGILVGGLAAVAFRMFGRYMGLVWIWAASAAASAAALFVASIVAFHVYKVVACPPDAPGCPF